MSRTTTVVIGVTLGVELWIIAKAVIGIIEVQDARRRLREHAQRVEDGVDTWAVLKEARQITEEAADGVG